MEKAIEGKIEVIGRDDFMEMVFKYHYSKILPKLTKLYLADRQLQAVMSLGWGVRPIHTIRKLFPSLSSKDYYEIGKMCIADGMPSNTATQFITRVIRFLKENCPEKKILFTWADGMLGKPGYVYQAANFLYGGYIWTDTYLSAVGEKIHPRTTGKIGGRPSDKKQCELGWTHWRGKQFRYIYFLCGKQEKNRLLSESTVDWSINNHPKGCDLEWQIKKDGKWVKSPAPPYDKNVADFSDNAKRVVERAKQISLFSVARSTINAD
jgi:hypothetical protein